MGFAERLPAIEQWVRDMRRVWRSAAILFVMAVGGTWYVASGFYAERIAALEATIKEKDASIQDREQRLGLRPQNDRFAKMNDKELIEETTRIVREIRGFHAALAKRRDDALTTSHEELEAVPPPKDKSAKELERYRRESNIPYFKYRRALDAIREDYAREFESRFSTDAYLLHEQLLKRLGDVDHQHMLERDYTSMEPGTGDLIATDLETLARRFTVSLRPAHP